MDVLTQTLTVAGLLVGVSMVVAVVIQGIVVLLGRSADRVAARAALAAPPAPDPAALPVDDGRPPAAHVAAIAAAVSVVFDDAQVVHIEPSRHDTSWTSAGRQAHHSSHHLGPRGSRRTGPPRKRGTS